MAAALLDATPAERHARKSGLRSCRSRPRDHDETHGSEWPDRYLPGHAAFGSWIYRITANAACQKRRRRRVEQAEVAWDDLAPSFDELGQHVQPGLDWSPRLKDPALQAELRSVLSAAIEALPEEYRAVLLLHDVEGLSSPDISEALQIKLGTIKSRVHRARLFRAKPPGRLHGEGARAPLRTTGSPRCREDRRSPRPR